MPESVTHRMQATPLDSMSKRELHTLVESLRADLASLSTKFNAVLAKLDADAGVTDVNYASTQGHSMNTVK